jgi:hypothetical protein
MYAAYLLSNLDHPDIGDLLLAVNNSLRRSEGFQKLGRAAVLVLRETEWGAAKQKNEAARRSILRGMEADATWELHLPLNWEYYGAEPGKVLQGLTLHLEGMSRSDEFMKRPHKLLVGAMARAIEGGVLRQKPRGDLEKGGGAT